MSGGEVKLTRQEMAERAYELLVTSEIGIVLLVEGEDLRILTIGTDDAGVLNILKTIVKAKSPSIIQIPSIFNGLV
jgi:hypothetical protein